MSCPSWAGYKGQRTPILHPFLPLAPQIWPGSCSFLPRRRGPGQLSTHSLRGPARAAIPQSQRPARLHSRLRGPGPIGLLSGPLHCSARRAGASASSMPLARCSLTRPLAPRPGPARPASPLPPPRGERAAGGACSSAGRAASPPPTPPARARGLCRGELLALGLTCSPAPPSLAPPAGNRGRGFRGQSGPGRPGHAD